MSYPGPPGSNPNSSSLPPRPPASKFSGSGSGFKPAFSPAANTPSPGARNSPYAAPPPAASAYPSYAGAPATAASQYGASPYGSYAAAPPGAAMSSGAGSYPTAGAYASYPNAAAPGAYGANYYGGAAPSAAGTAASAYATPPSIRNPFPVPSQAAAPGGSDDYDPEMAAQIAQWQSAYVKDPAKEGGAAAAAAAAVAAPAAGVRGANGSSSAGFSAEAANRMSEAAAANAAAAASDGKKKTVVRAGGGQKWTDDTLLEWDPAHLRLFVGNLAGETTDESLYKAFSRWKSLQKARVVRDKVTSKSRGYGFVSFSDPDEFFSAAKEMNGKYIQSHPVVVRKSTTEIKPQTVKDKHHPANRHHNKNRNKNKNRSGNGSGGDGGGGGAREGSFEPSLGPTGGGVHKPGQKTKGGLKLLG